MTAYNVVRFKVKPGMEKAFEDAHRIEPGFARVQGRRPGEDRRPHLLLRRQLERFRRTRCRRGPKMLPILDSIPPYAGGLGGGLGVTDPVSGSAVVEFPASTGLNAPDQRQFPFAGRIRLD